MPELLARILFLFLLFSLIKSWWDTSGGKDNPLIDRLRVLLLISLLFLAFFAPDTPVGAAIFGLIAFFFKPLGFSITLLVIASALITNGGIRNPAPRMILAALLVLILSSMPVVAYWFADQAERDAAARTTVCCDETAAAIVLLGKGTTQPHHREAIQLTDAGNRLPYAAVLYKKQLAPLVIVSAGPRAELQNYTGEAKDIETLLASNMGVPRTSIVLDDNGSNIRTSAEEVRKILDSRGVGRKVILVTSAIQMRRASLAFANMGIQVIPRATDFYTYQPVSGGKSRLRLDAADFLPSAEALVTTTKVFDEYFGSFYYYLRGWQAPRA
ncbi:YdcF family protein [Microcoleus sp. LEGE 07076]|uniref:YdcF family protein n=1 Tax=Microcoleus sp. LEGE 07076 TaxID=915322 RepID=UPI00188180C0|nr:YdcF family protein [Microcoleus sp. LEGE 07076]MBE9187695.1 YdcF family protein [Microcoleus sp. LEGE 07076]